MFLSQLHFATFAAVALCLCSWLVELHVRNHRSWEAIVERLTPAEQRHSDWSRLKCAGVLMEMADYVERKVSGADPAQLAAMRRDAIAIRMDSAKALAGFARRGTS